MPFYIRKSIAAGPFRFNLSKSGVGLSVGVRGLRIGTGPRGHYVHAGAGGLYYRSSIRRAGQKRPAHEAAPQSFAQEPAAAASEYYHPTVDMIEVESGDVMEMADSRFSDIVADLNGRTETVKLAHIFGGGGAILWFFAMLGLGFASAVPFLLLAGLLWALGAYLDSYRRSSVVFYDLEADAQAAYLRLLEAFQILAACNAKWHVAAGGAVRDLDTWKRNAGASHIISKSAIQLTFSLPAELKSNVTPPSMPVGKQVLYFLPDVILLKHDGRFGAIGYDTLRVCHQSTRFIEDGAVPGDAQIVDQTWLYLNKKGGPDRRFNNNRMIPICLYESMHLQSASGLNELLEFSRTGVVSQFDNAVRSLAQVITVRRAEMPALSSPGR